MKPPYFARPNPPPVALRLSHAEAVDALVAAMTLAEPGQELATAMPLVRELFPISEHEQRHDEAACLLQEKRRQAVLEDAGKLWSEQRRASDQLQGYTFRWKEPFPPALTKIGGK